MEVGDHSFDTDDHYPSQEEIARSSGKKNKTFSPRSFRKSQDDYRFSSPQGAFDTLIKSIIQKVGKDSLEKAGGIPRSIQELEKIAKPLQWAVQKGDGKSLVLAITAEANPNLTGGPHDRTPLHEAALKGDREALRYLIRNGAAIDLCDNTGNTPLNLLCQVKPVDWKKTHTDCLNYLISKGASVDAVPQEGWGAPMHQLAANSNYEALEIALNKATEIDARAANGDNVIHLLIHNSARVPLEKELGKIAAVFEERGVSWAESKDRDGLTWERLIEIRLVTCIRPPEGQKLEYNIYTEQTKDYESYMAELSNAIKKCKQHNIENYQRREKAFNALVQAIKRYQLRGEWSDQKISSDKIPETMEELEQLFTPCQWAVANNNREILLLALQADANINLREKESGDTPLDKAVIHVRPELLKMLIKMGAEVDSHDLSRTTALYKLCQVKTDEWTGAHTKCLEYLLSKGASVDTIPSAGSDAPIHCLARNQNYPALELALKKVKNVNCVNSSGDNILHLLIKHSQGVPPVEELANVITLFRKRGGRMNSKNSEECTIDDLIHDKIEVFAQEDEKTAEVTDLFNDYLQALSFDYKKQQTKFKQLANEIRNSLLPHEVTAIIQSQSSGKWPSNMKELEEGLPPLHWALKESLRYEFLKLAIELGANINLQDKNGQTALHIAAPIGIIRLLKFLITKRAKVDLCDHEGKTALHLLCDVQKKHWKKGHTDCLRHLIKNNASVDVVPEEGDNAPIHHLASRRNYQALIIALENAKDVNTVDKNGNTIAHLLVMSSPTPPTLKELKKVLDCFIQRGGLLDIVNTSGETFKDLITNKLPAFKKKIEEAIRLKKMPPQWQKRAFDIVAAYKQYLQDLGLS